MGSSEQIVGEIASRSVRDNRRRADHEASQKAADRIGRRLDQAIYPGIQRLHRLILRLDLDATEGVRKETPVVEEYFKILPKIRSRSG